MKTIFAKASFDYEELVFCIQDKPEMEDNLIFMGIKGIVVGLNDNYKDTGETWLIVQWNDGKQEHYQYIVGEKK